MKILDRYILIRFSVPFLYCFVSFLMIYILFDLFDNLSEFLLAEVPPSNILQYYMILLPSAVVYIAPISLLLGVLYCLAQFTRHNELTAMRSGGISFNRLMIPFIVVGVFASILVGIVNETLAPWSSYRTEQLVSLYRRLGDTDVFYERNLPYRNIRHKRTWMIDRFNTETHEMEGVNLILQHRDGWDQARVQAERGGWRAGEIWLYDAHIQKLRPDGRLDGLPDYHESIRMEDFDESPQDFLSQRKDPEHMSASEIQRFMDTHNLEPRVLARLRVDKLYRLAIPWSCLIITMIGIPFGAHTGRKGTLAGIVMILTMFFAYYSLIYICLGLAKNGYIGAYQGVWTPHAVFLLVAVLMNMKMR